MLVTALLAACGSNSPTSVTATSNARGTLIQTPPPRIASLDAATFESQLAASQSGQQLLQITGKPACGVDFYYINYWTVGGIGEPATATGALMVPTGSTPQCSGGRPIVLYAHSTTPDKNYNIADITNPANTEGALVAAMFAAQGFIVVAPNYAGYDASSLHYHPFLNAAQQSSDMIDALAASRTALPHTFAAATTDNGQLFVTGYSQGGHVAMATHRALQQAGQKVTAAAPMSGPYALLAFGDVINFGSVNIGATVFEPLLARSYQFSYGNVYVEPTDAFEPNYANNAVTLLPSTTPIETIFANNQLPESALFNSTTPVTGTPLDALLKVPSNPVFAAGFGPENLATNDYRVAYALDAVANPDGALPCPGSTTSLPCVTGAPVAANPQQTLRQDLKKNDLRNWIPEAPVLLCGGDQDPTVFFLNTTWMAEFWSQLPAGLVTVLDVAAPVAGATDPFAAVKIGFQQTETALATPPQGSPQAAIESYHGTVAPFCSAAARAFFTQF
jgi:pimeloyl-ACP methyl ester carboxylesterase